MPKKSQFKPHYESNSSDTFSILEKTEYKVQTKEEKVVEKKNEFENALKSSKMYKNAMTHLVNLTDYKGKTALHYAVYMSNLKLV